MEKGITLSYRKIDNSAVDPEYNYPSDSGFDLYSTENIQIYPLGRELVGTGLQFEIPVGFEIQIRSKSGLALKSGLMVLNSPGTIDRGYIGEIKVILFNASQSLIKIEKGQKIAQACLCPVVPGHDVELVLQNQLEGERGDNGFGSTGLYLKEQK
ncbi:dUTP diphosphatase [bacterium]|jgi:dUTP pyrophosphatase|nr:dUTP diphosphatase [Candidatus Elulimicrobium humile]